MKWGLQSAGEGGACAFGVIFKKTFPSDENPSTKHSKVSQQQRTSSCTTVPARSGTSSAVYRDRKAVMSGESQQVVLVTGGSGFLGQHIVKILQERSNDVKEIRVFDIKPYEKNLDYEGSKPVRSIEGDIRDPNMVKEAVKDADTVIHSAGLVSFGNFPNYKGMEEVNVTGTKNVIDACIDQNVPRLVFTSTIDVVIGYDEIINGDETLPIPPKFLFSGYPDTKFRAERSVLEANGRLLRKGDGSCLRTLVLRPNVMYGEGDPFYVTNGLRSAKDSRGVLLRVGNGSALFQQAYVGNMAWAHICAMNALRSDPSTVAGQVFFVTDDTPLQNSFDFMKPFLEARGYSLSQCSIPYFLVYGALWTFESLLWLLKPIKQVKLNVTLESVIYINMSIYFSRKLAEKRLGYKPIYSYDESMEKSMNYYRTVNLNSS